MGFLYEARASLGLWPLHSQDEIRVEKTPSEGPQYHISGRVFNSPPDMGVHQVPPTWYPGSVPTPVGHSLGGLAVYLAARWPQKDWFLVGGVAVSAVLPDLDFAIQPFAGRSYHRYFSHSLGFSVLFAVAAYLILKWLGRTSPRRDAVLMGAGYVSHIVLDLFSHDTHPPFGIQLFWPFSDGFVITPVQIFPEVWRGSVAVLFGLHNWLAAGIEFLVLLPFVVSLWWLRGRRGQSE